MSTTSIEKKFSNGILLNLVRLQTKEIGMVSADHLLEVLEVGVRSSRPILSPCISCTSNHMGVGFCPAKSYYQHVAILSPFISGSNARLKVGVWFSKDL